MKARDIQVGMTIKATPFMEDPIEGLVEEIKRTSASGGCLVSFKIKGYQRPFPFRGSANVKVIKNDFK